MGYCASPVVQIGNYSLYMFCSENDWVASLLMVVLFGEMLVFSAIFIIQAIKISFVDGVILFALVILLVALEYILALLSTSGDRLLMITTAFVVAINWYIPFFVLFVVILVLNRVWYLVRQAIILYQLTIFLWQDKE